MDPLDCVAFDWILPASSAIVAQTVTNGTNSIVGMTLVFIVFGVFVFLSLAVAAMLLALSKP